MLRAHNRLPLKILSILLCIIIIFMMFSCLAVKSKAILVETAVLTVGGLLILMAALGITFTLVDGVSVQTITDFLYTKWQQYKTQNQALADAICIIIERLINTGRTVLTWVEQQAIDSVKDNFVQAQTYVPTITFPSDIHNYVGKYAIFKCDSYTYIACSTYSNAEFTLTRQDYSTHPNVMTWFIYSRDRTTKEQLNFDYYYRANNETTWYKYTNKSFKDTGDVWTTTDSNTPAVEGLQFVYNIHTGQYVNVPVTPLINIQDNQEAALAADEYIVVQETLTSETVNALITNVTTSQYVPPKTTFTMPDSYFISSNPYKVAYQEGETFNPAGLQITGITNGIQYPVSPLDLTFSPVGALTPADKTVDVYHLGAYAGTIPIFVEANDDVEDVPIEDYPGPPEEGSEEETSLKALFFSKFPFCLPYDIYYAFKLIAADPDAPRFEIDLMTPFKNRISFFGDTKIVIDFDDYPIVGQVSRWGFTISFCLVLIAITRKISNS